MHATAIHHSMSSSSSSSDSKAEQHVEPKASHLQSHDFSHKQGSYTFRRVKVTCEWVNLIFNLSIFYLEYYPSVVISFYLTTFLVIKISTYLGCWWRWIYRKLSGLDPDGDRLRPCGRNHCRRCHQQAQKLEVKNMTICKIRFRITSYFSIHA